jgi:hypothetical protein
VSSIRAGENSADGPELSVLLPLEHAHGDVLDFLRGWTERQTLERDRYQLVVAAPADCSRALLDRVSALLGGRDIVVQTELGGSDEVPLWNAAARAATAPWLLFSESHCMPSPDCLAKLFAAIAATPQLSVLTLANDHHVDNRLAAIGAEWVEAIGGARRAAAWRPIQQQGTAIRAGVFHELGGLDERAGMFSMDALGARLHTAGFAIGHIEGSRVRHHFEPDLPGVRAMTVDYTLGECRLRESADGSEFEAYHGRPREWDEPFALGRASALAVARALGGELARALASGSRDAGWLAREQLTWLAAAGGDVAPALYRARAGEQLAAVATRIAPGRAGYRAFLGWHAQVVAVTRLRWLREHRQAAPSARRLDGTLDASRLDAGVLTGGFALEHANGVDFRWAGPVARLRLFPRGAGRALVIDTLGLRGPPSAYVRAVYAGRRRVAPSRIGGDSRRLAIELGARDVAAAARQGIVILSRPLIPARTGSPDRRRLGLPIAAVEASAS